MSDILKHTINKLPLTKNQKKNLNSNKIKDSAIKVTRNELKDLKDNSQLVPGRWYRMTDYETIVNPSNEDKLTGHQFDLLILATDVNKLSEHGIVMYDISNLIP
ncbi:MAG: hypothetical protein MJ209_00135 [archaeon]|nr:hypothetical protein [archaeon]